MKPTIHFICIVLLGFWWSGCADVFYVENPAKPPKSVPAKRVKYLEHTVRPGETLSQIAVHYYGTYKQFDVVSFIRKFNDIPDVRNLQTGEILKIPYIKAEGVVRPDPSKLKQVSIATRKLPAAPAEPAQETEAIPAPDQKPYEELLAEGSELLDQKRYSEAISIFEKTSEARPDDPEARKYLYTAYFQHAVEQYEQGDYQGAQASFQKVMKYRHDCRECIEYAKIISEKGNTLLAKGIQLFNDKKYAEAITALEKASALAPDNPKVGEYLFKSYFEQAQEYYRDFQSNRDKLDYLAAQRALDDSRKYQTKCPKCIEYEDIFKQKHYNKGIELYIRKESEGVDEAIREWERVLFVDPGYKKVKENIEEASNLQRKLREINKKSGRTDTYGSYSPRTWDSTTVTLSAPPASFASSMNPSTF